MSANARTLIRVDIDIRQPWAVGGVPRARATVDLPILLDLRSAGAEAGVCPENQLQPRNPFLPASSLVGSLRRHLDRAGHDHEYWLGRAEATQDQAATPSRLRCLGVQLTGTTTVATRRTTKIDELRQAAWAKTLREEEVVPVTDRDPTIARWWLQLDRSCDRLPELLTALLTWRPIVGRRRSVGQGEAAVTGVHYAGLDLADVEHLGWWLVERHEWDGEYGEHQPPGWGRFERELEVLPTGPPPPILARFTVSEPLYLGSDEVKKSAGGRGETHVSQRQIPGSSWKGIFRHRTSHILRVCGYSDADRVISELFGIGRLGGASEHAGVRGKLSFQTTVLPEGVATVTRTHVAIDRVTGGAHDRSGKPRARRRGGALFSVEAIDRGTPVELRIESTAALTPFERQLLEHVIRDIGDGILGVGGLTSRGYGTLRLAEPREAPAPFVRGSNQLVQEEGR